MLPVSLVVALATLTALILKRYVEFRDALKSIGCVFDHWPVLTADADLTPASSCIHGYAFSQKLPGLQDSHKLTRSDRPRTHRTCYSGCHYWEIRYVEAEIQ